MDEFDLGGGLVEPVEDTDAYLDDTVLDLMREQESHHQPGGDDPAGPGNHPDSWAQLQVDADDTQDPYLTT